MIKIHHLFLHLPWPPSVLSPNARTHWANLAKAKKKYRRECALIATQQGARKINAQHLDVEFVFHPPSKRRIDLDNCIARMKSGIDGIADVIGVDDSKWRMSFELAESERGGRVRITITEKTERSENDLF